MAKRRSEVVAASLLTAWTDADTAMQIVGASLGVFGAGPLDPTVVLAGETPLRNALFDVLLSLVEGGALEMHTTNDLRYAFRTLVANPGFAIVAVLCLSLGIGVNGTIFSVVDGVLLQPYPFPDAERIVVLNSTNPKQGITRAGVSYPDFKDWRDESTSFSAVAGFQGRSLTISDTKTQPAQQAPTVRPSSS